MDPDFLKQLFQQEFTKIVAVISKSFGLQYIEIRRYRQAKLSYWPQNLGRPKRSCKSYGLALHGCKTRNYWPL
jgi:hypothetical protein